MDLVSPPQVSVSEAEDVKLTLQAFNKKTYQWVAFYNQVLPVQQIWTTLLCFEEDQTNFKF